MSSAAMAACADGLPTGAALVRRVVFLSFVVSLPALGLVVTCLLSLLELTPDEWRFFLLTTAVYGALVTLPTARIQKRYLAPIAVYLDGRPGEDALREAFAGVMRVPQRCAAVGVG